MERTSRNRCRRCRTRRVGWQPRVLVANEFSSFRRDTGSRDDVVVEIHERHGGADTFDGDCHLSPVSVLTVGTFLTGPTLPGANVTSTGCDLAASSGRAHRDAVPLAVADLTLNALSDRKISVWPFANSDAAHFQYAVCVGSEHRERRLHGSVHVEDQHGFSSFVLRTICRRMLPPELILQCRRHPIADAATH